MLENGAQGLVVRAEPLVLAAEIARRIVEVVRLEDGALLLDVDPAWAGALNVVLVKKGVRVSELTRARDTALRLQAGVSQRRRAS